MRAAMMRWITSSVAVSCAKLSWQAKASTSKAQDKSITVMDERDMTTLKRK